MGGSSLEDYLGTNKGKNYNEIFSEIFSSMGANLIVWSTRIEANETQKVLQGNSRKVKN